MPNNDLDLVSLDSGLDLARSLARQLNVDFFTLDKARQTARVVSRNDESPFTIDVATVNGDGLADDLAKRDFTINSLAVALDDLDRIIDPLGGQSDLLNTRTLRLCSPLSIVDDPVRAFRAVRFALFFRLHLDPGARDAVRNTASRLVSADGELHQPERVRDELFKTLVGSFATPALRLYDALGLLKTIFPSLNVNHDELISRVGAAQCLQDLLSIIGSRRDDNAAADLTLGVAVMILDRFRSNLQARLSQESANRRSRSTHMILHSFGRRIIPWHTWGKAIRLSNDETTFQNSLEVAVDFPESIGLPWPDRQLFRFHKSAPDVGPEAVLIALAQYLAEHQPTPDPRKWGHLLTNIAAPLLDAYFNRYFEVVEPVPLVDGHALITALRIHPGPMIGKILDRLIEEQAAGTIHTKQQAIRMAREIFAGPHDAFD